MLNKIATTVSKRVERANNGLIKAASLFQDGQKRKSERLQFRNKYLFVLYKIFISVPVLNLLYRRTVNKTKLIYPSEQVKLNMKTTEIMGGAILKLLAIFLFGIVFWDGNIFYLSAIVLTGMVVLMTSIDGKINDINIKILWQMKKFVNILRTAYNRTPILTDALYESIQRSPYEISLHLIRIYDYLTDPSMEQKTASFVQTLPNRFMTQFVTFASTTKRNGDSKDEKGMSRFLLSLTNLERELESELIILNDRQKRFKSAIRQVFLGVFMCPFIKMFAIFITKQTPKAAEFIDSPIGIGILILVFILTFVCYLINTQLGNATVNTEISKSFFSRLAEKRYISQFLTIWINKKFNYKRYEYYNERLKSVGDITGKKAFACKQFLCGIILAFTMFVVCSTGMLYNKYTVLKDYENAFDNMLVPNETYLENMKRASLELGNKYKGIEITDKNRSEVQSQLANDLLKEHIVGENKQIADIIIGNIESYQDTFFQFYYLIFSILAGLAGFYAPIKFLDFKYSLMHFAQDDEVNQFNSLVITLMNVGGVTEMNVLEWMRRFSFCFKNSIQECINEFDLGKEKAFRNLKLKETNEEFRYFVENLMAVDKVGIKKAFMNVESEREYILRKREQDMIEINAKNQKKAMRLTFVPLLTLFIGHLIIPLGIFIYNTFMPLFASMS